MWWEWTGRRAHGAVLHGCAQASLPSTVRQQLGQRGICVTRLIPRPTWRYSLPAAGQRLEADLGMLLHAGLPLLEALRCLSHASPHAGWKWVVDELRQRVASGQSLSASLQDVSYPFAPWTIRMISLGESSGTLVEVLQQLSRRRTRSQRLRRRVTQALWYPATVLVGGVAVVVLLGVFVVPSFRTFFESLGGSLPAATQWILAASERLTHPMTGVSFLGLVGVAPLLNAWWQRRAGRSLGMTVIRRLPGISATLRWAEVTLWLQSLGALVQAGIPIHDALGASHAALQDADIAPVLGNIHRAVRRGEPLHRCVTQLEDLPPWAQQLCAIGESSGTLDLLLVQAGDAMEEQLERRLTGLSQLVEPLLLAAMGLLIGGIVLALYLPILQLGTLA